MFANADPRVDGLSIIIPAYNCAAWILSSLKSVLSQDSVVPLEVVVDDDCSTDQTVEFIRVINDARISCRPTRKNVGVAAAKNIGIKLAKFD